VSPCASIRRSFGWRASGWVGSCAGFLGDIDHVVSLLLGPLSEALVDLGRFWPPGGPFVTKISRRRLVGGCVVREGVIDSPECAAAGRCRGNPDPVRPHTVTTAPPSPASTHPARAESPPCRHTGRAHGRTPRLSAPPPERAAGSAARWGSGGGRRWTASARRGCGAVAGPGCRLGCIGGSPSRPARRRGTSVAGVEARSLCPGDGAAVGDPPRRTGKVQARMITGNGTTSRI